MAKNIEHKLKKIGDYLKLEEDTVFTITEYQRAYSWGIDNCDKLWQDINDFVESESKDRYFFGTIIINCQDNDTKYGLIDGPPRPPFRHDTGRAADYALVRADAGAHHRLRGVPQRHLGEALY